MKSSANFMTDKPPTTVSVPDAEAARQAVDAWGGYTYQLDHTVLRWLTLGDGELLHVEFAEDIAVSDDGKLDMTQIKRLKANITLRSDGVAKLIAAVWSFQKENPDRWVSSALLTTSGIGKEQKMSFPGDVPGLVYWRTAAREGADVEPIRIALLRLDLPQDVRAFISDAPAADLRARIIIPIQWLERGPSSNDLRRNVEEQLILLGSRMGVPASTATNARDHLIAALLDTIPLAPEKRYVTKTDLIKVFQNKTLVTLPPAMLEGLTMLGAGGTSVVPTESIARDIALIPLARRTAARKPLVESLREKLVSRGALWIHGSNGLGKSTLALLVARSQRAAWRVVDLRDVTSATARSMLIGVAGGFRRTGARGLILDDIPANPDSSLVSAIGQVAHAVADADGVLIVTGMKAPPPTVAARIGLSPAEIIDVPYLTQDDVADMVSAAGGDPEKWARVVHALAAFGHPLLVDAKIAGLEQRGWDNKEMLNGIIPVEGKPDEMAAERENVRNRLVQELRPDQSELLLRLSLFLGNFDRKMALVAADTPTAIAQAGLIFDFLVGPWIEQVGSQRYRLSPLLKDSGAVGLSEPQQRAVKTDVMNHLMLQRPFPADQLLQVFAAAIQLGDHDGLTWFGHVVLTASTQEKKSQFKRLAQGISAFAIFDKGEGNLLIPDDTKLSTLLRFAQLRVAVANEDMKRAATLVDRALAENVYVEETGRPLYNAMIYSTVLLETRIPIGPKRWLPMLAEVVATPEMAGMLTIPLPTGGLFDGRPANATSEEILFIARAAASKSVGELAELIDTLEEQPKALRDRYLGSAARTNQSLHLIVAGSWLAEVKRDGFDARAAATTFHRLSETETAKANADLAVELLCAEAVMLDEYAEDEGAALEALRAAQEKYPSDYRLNRQRQKVFYRHKEYAEALEEFAKFQERMPKERAVDRAYAMREAGKSAAEMGDLAQARTFFGEAWESARVCSDTMKPMTAGLSADCAILAFDDGDEEAAVALMHRALLEADGLDPKKGLKEAYIKRVHMAAILYMRGAAKDFPAARQARVYGMCSEPEPNEWFRNQRQPQASFVWYQLAELEAEVSKGHTVLDELRRSTKAERILPLELMLTSRATEAALRQFDVDRFLERMSTYPRAIVLAARSLGTSTDPFNMPVGTVAPVTEGEWGDKDIAEVTRNAVMCFMLLCAATGRADVLAELRYKLDAIPGLGEMVRDLFQVMDAPSAEEKDVDVIIPSIAGRLMAKEVFDARDAYLSAIYILQLLEGSTLSPPVAEAIMVVFDTMWPEIIEKRSFSMRSPLTNGPIILDAMRKGDTALQRMANLVLGAEAAESRHLSDDLRNKFSKMAQPRPKPAVITEEDEP